MQAEILDPVVLEQLLAAIGGGKALLAVLLGVTLAIRALRGPVAGLLADNTLVKRFLVSKAGGWALNGALHFLGVLAVELQSGKSIGVSLIVSALLGALMAAVSAGAHAAAKDVAQVVGKKAADAPTDTLNS